MFITGFKNFNRRQLLGIILVTISTIAWTMVFFIPFLPFENTVKITAIAGLIILGEVTGYPGLALLGKDALKLIKDKFKKLKIYFNLKSKRDDSRILVQESK